MYLIHWPQCWEHEEVLPEAGLLSSTNGGRNAQIVKVEPAVRILVTDVLGDLGSRRPRW